MPKEHRYLSDVLMPKSGCAVQLPTLRRIVLEEGSRALWKGVQARVLFHFPASAICWGTYESMKRALQGSERG